ncbi:MAG: hypothetical protein V4584_00250 [Verrucomicrobiota bacterium]
MFEATALPERALKSVPWFATLPYFSMSDYHILDHSERLPHKQAFKILLPDRISEPVLTEFTDQIARAHRKGAERIFIHWWLASQDQSVEMCWAHSRMVDGNVHVETNLLSLEEHLEAVETRPLREDSELGLWHWDLGSNSHFIHLIDTGTGQVEVRKSFLDGSKGSEFMRILGESPLRLEGTGDQYLEAKEDGLVLGDDDGFVIVPRIR